MRWWIPFVLAGCARIESYGPPTALQLASACIKYSACGPPTVTGCINYAYSAESDLSVYRPQELRCLADENSGDCSAILACIDMECPRSTCELGPCTDLGFRGCSGSRIETCEYNGTLTSFDCSIYGETCVDTGIGASCGAPATGCAPGCDGTTLVRCDFEAPHRIDCGSLYSAGKCQSRVQSCGYAEQCSVVEDPSCIGNVVHVCALGEVVEIDCVAIGFARCSNGGCFAN